MELIGDMTIQTEQRQLLHSSRVQNDDIRPMLVRTVHLTQDIAIIFLFRCRFWDKNGIARKGRFPKGNHVTALSGFQIYLLETIHVACLGCPGVGPDISFSILLPCGIRRGEFAQARLWSDTTVVPKGPPVDINRILPQLTNGDFRM